MKPLTKYLTLSTTIASSMVYYSEVNNSLYEQHNEYYKKIDNDIKYLKLKTNLSTDFKSPKYPIILCHGLSGFSTLQLLPSFSQIKSLFNSDTLNEARGILCIDYWHGIKEKLEDNGCKVFIAKVSPYGSIRSRAETLNGYISEICAKEDIDKVNLIAHSMGGLDCRYLISGIKNKPYTVLSITTISTPHKGSEIADVMSRFDVILPQAFEQLTTDYVDKFNEQYPKDDNVKYFSYGAYCWPRWYNFFYITWKYLFYNNEDEPLEKRINDGLVTLDSAKYGEYLGTLRHVDHLTLINWMDLSKKLATFRILNAEKNVQKVDKTNNADITDDIDILQFYVEICDNLGRLGF